MGKTGVITIKGTKVKDTAPEYEYNIPFKDAQEMLNTMCLKYPIEKTRYRVRVLDHVWEIDEFLGLNKGLVLAEVELKPGEKVPDKPKWAGKNVTTDPKYFNSSLSKHPYTTWKRGKVT